MTDLIDELVCNPDRLQTLNEYAVVDTGYEDRFDEIARLAAGICDTPISLVSLVLDDRQWFKSHIGLEARQTSIEVSFCKHAMAQDEPVFVVEDAMSDPRFRENALVTGHPNIRFYAGATLTSADGHPLGTLCVIDDAPRSLSERQRLALQVLARQVMTQLEVRRSERERDVAKERAATEAARFIKAVESIRDSFYTLDHDLRFTFANQRFLELAQRPLEDLLGQRLEDTAPDSNEYGVIDALNLALETGETISHHFSFTPFGRDYEMRIHPWEQGLTVLVTDATERRRAERELERQAAAIEQAREAIIVLDLDGDVSFCNSAALCLHGYREPCQDSRQLLGFADQTYDDAFSMTAEVGSWEGEVQCTSRDGRDLILESRWALIVAEDGEPSAMLVINYDVTERRRLEDDVLRSQRTETIGRLAGGIAHDLNNVLSPILVTASMLAECVDDDLRQDVELIEDSARRGAAMVNQLLTFARGRETMRTSIDAREAVADVVRLMRETFPKSIDVAVEIEGEPTVHADPTQLDQVLTNLAVNARDALPAGGQITFRVRERFVAEPRDGGLAGSYVIFEIEDDGIGIKPEDMPSIFDPYFTTKPHGHGTGLGLSTSQGIVRGHGGFISVESTLNEGTKISAHFPSSTPTLDLESSVVQDSESTEKLAGRILVVDDEEAILRAATRTLELAGFEVVTARNGAEGIATFVQTDDVDLVITDVMMPQMGGHSTITAVRALNPEIPIIVWSGRVEQEALDEIRAEGIQGFLPKPFAMNDLVKMIRTALTHQDGS